MNRFFGIAVLLLLLLPAQGIALEIYLNTNSPANVSRGSQLFESEKWVETAKAIDGIWFVAQGMTKPPDGISITQARKRFVQDHQNLKWIVEVNQKAVESRADGKKYSIYEPKVMNEMGIQGFAVMSFFEDRPQSTLTTKDISIARQALTHMKAPDVPLIVNTRIYSKNDYLQKLVASDLIQGFSYEFASKPITEGRILETEVAGAIRDGFKHRKVVYLLINAEKSKSFRQDIEQIITRLAKSCPQELATPAVRIVLSNYSGSDATPFTPERDKGGNYANTTTGTALWLAHTADTFGLRRRSAVPATPPVP